MPCRVWDVNRGASGIDSSPVVGARVLYDPESDMVLLFCVGSLGMERLPTPDERIDEPENVSRGVMVLLFPACTLESRRSDDKEIVITDV